MRDIALALFVFGMIPFILVRPYLGLLVWSWLGYMNPNRLTYGFAYNFPWVEVVAIATLLGLLLGRERKLPPWSSVLGLLLLYLAWTGVTTVFAAMPGPAWLKWQEFAKILVMVFVTLMLVDSRERVRWLVWIIVVSLGFFGVKGGVFTALGGGVNHVLGPPASFIRDNNALALALCMSLPLMRYLQLHESRKLVRVGMGFAMLFTGVAVLGTYSRGGFIALAVVAAALLLKSRRRLALVVAVLVVGTVAVQFMPAKWVNRMATIHHGSDTASGETRIQSWEFATNVALHRPLRGGGFEVYQSQDLWQRYAPEGSVQRAIHSIYFRTLGEQGFIGLGLFLTLLIVAWRNCARVRRWTRHEPDWKWAFDLASMLQVCLIAYATAGAFLPMPYFDLTYQLLALTAITVGLCTSGAGEGRDAAGGTTQGVAMPQQHVSGRRMA